MATSINNTAANANVVSKSATANAATQPVKTQRVLETRDQWVVIFNHAVSLVVMLTKGEALPKDARKGFAFGTTKEAPHCRQYAQSLIGGFLTGKAGKVLAQHEVLASREKREEIACNLLLQTSIAKDGQAGAKRILSKAEPKQAKAFANAVLTALTAPAVPEVAPKEQTTKKTAKSKGKK